MADFEPGQLALYCGHLTSIEDIPKEQSNQIKIFVSCNPPGEGELYENLKIFSDFFTQGKDVSIFPTCYSIYSEVSLY